MSEIGVNRREQEIIGEIDARFLSMVNLLADRHGAVVTKLDIEGRVIEFDCDDDVSFALELGELFSEYLV